MNQKVLENGEIMDCAQRQFLGVRAGGQLLVLLHYFKVGLIRIHKM